MGSPLIFSPALSASEAMLRTPAVGKSGLEWASSSHSLGRTLDYNAYSEARRAVLREYRHIRSMWDAMKCLSCSSCPHWPLPAGFGGFQCPIAPQWPTSCEQDQQIMMSSYRFESGVPVN